MSGFRLLIVETHHMRLPCAIYGSLLKIKAACFAGDACDTSLHKNLQSFLNRSFKTDPKSKHGRSR
jgi:hypothetical protein